MQNGAYYLFEMDYVILGCIIQLFMSIYKTHFEHLQDSNFGISIFNRNLLIKPNK